MLCDLKMIRKASGLLKTLEPWKTCLFQLQFLKETQEFLKAFLREKFDLVRLLNSIKLISWIEFDLVRLGSIHYAGYIKEGNFLIIIWPGKCWRLSNVTRMAEW